LPQFKKKNIRKYTIILFFSLFTISAFAQTSLYEGTWKGIMLSNTSDVDNGKGLPVTLFISSDNEAGEMVGEMSIQYRYQTDIYKAKYSVNGLIDYENKSIYIEQVKLIYYDLLPRGLQWCFGNGTFQIFRNPYKKKNYLDGYMTTSCGPEKLRMVLIKK
jgi:hypothetical protein